MNRKEKVMILKRFAKLAEENVTLEEIKNYDSEKRMKKNKEYMRYIVDAIVNVRDDDQRNALQQIYILGRTREKTAERMNFCVSHINRIHNNAVDNIDLKILEKIKI
ncbi:MAG: hypothetical protein II309_02035 [Bacilli bacterium]|nr:hypothetical protein [Bacilli bacterium]